MTDLFDSLKDAPLGVFNSYHYLYASGLSVPDDEYGEAGFIDLKPTETSNIQHRTDLDKTQIHQSTFRHDEDYFLTPMQTSKDIHSHVQLSDYVSNGDRKHALSVRGFKLYKQVYKLYKDKTTKNSAKRELKELLDLLSAAKSAHKAQVTEIGSARQIRINLLASKYSKALPDLRDPFSGTKLEVLRTRWKQIKSKVKEDQKADAVREEELVKKMHALRAQQEALKCCLDSNLQAADLPCPKTAPELVKEREQIATEIAKLTLRLKEKGSSEATSGRDAKAIDFGGRS